MEIEEKLRNAEVINQNIVDRNKINLGSKIKLLDIEFNEELNYIIVGSTESDPANGKISNESPLGNALIGHGVGDIIDVDSPSGIIKYKVLEIM